MARILTSVSHSKETSEEPGSESGLRRRSLSWLFFVCLLLFLVSLLSLWRRSHGGDFPQLYVEAKLLAQGQPIYRPKQLEMALRQVAPDLVPSLYLNGADGIIYYPPSTGIVCLPLALFTYPVALQIAFWVSMGALLAGIWTLMRAFAPQWPLFARVLALVALLNSFAVRDAVGQLQSVVLAIGLLALCLIACKQGRDSLLFACTVVALCLKMTLGLPFLALLLLRGRVGLLLGALALFGLVNGIGFLRTGGKPSFDDYRRDIARFEVNPLSSPDPHTHWSSERTDWQYLFNGLHPNRTAARQLAQALTLLTLLFLAYAAWRGRRLEANAEFLIAFLAPVTCLSLLCVYHHVYDTSLLWIPLILWRSGPPSLSRSVAGVAFQLLVLDFVCVRPFFRQTAHLLGGLLRMDALVVERILGSFLLTVALVMALIALQGYLAARLANLQEASARRDEAVSVC